MAKRLVALALVAAMLVVAWPALREAVVEVIVATLYWLGAPRGPEHF